MTLLVFVKILKHVFFAFYVKIIIIIIITIIIQHYSND
jgi:hypothetical protein